MKNSINLGYLTPKRCFVTLCEAFEIETCQKFVPVVINLRPLRVCFPLTSWATLSRSTGVLFWGSFSTLQKVKFLKFIHLLLLFPRRYWISLSDISKPFFGTSRWTEFLTLFSENERGFITSQLCKLSERNRFEPRSAKLSLTLLS